MIMMMELDDIQVVPFKKVLKKKAITFSDSFSIPAAKEFIAAPQIQKLPQNVEEIPMEQWIMPPQPDRYIRYGKYDFL